jgi:cytochrome P450
MAESSPSIPTINPLDTEFARDPYPALKTWREQAPLHFDPLMSAWVVSRLDYVIEISTDPRFCLDIRQWEKYVPPVHPDLHRFSAIDDAGLFNLPKADHTRVRRLVGKAFTPRAVEALRPMIEEILDEVLAPVRGTGRIELVSQLADFYPIRVISRMLGIEANSQRERRFKELSDVVISLQSPLLGENDRLEMMDDRAELLELIQEVVAERKQDPGDDILSRLIAAEEEGEHFSNDEMLALLTGLVTAGSETTANALTLGVREMLHSPGQLALYRERPDLRRNAVDELLRVQMPGYYGMRVANEDVPFAGETIRKGQLVLTNTAAAHRDPELFPNPDAVDIARDLGSAAVFGRGAHLCLAAQLARLELERAYTRLFTEFDGLRLAIPYDEVPFASHPLVRRIAELPLEFDD